MRILATFDGSPLSESIIPQLNKMAAIPDTEVVLVRVEDMPQGQRQRESFGRPVVVGPAAAGGTTLVVQTPRPDNAETREQAVERVRDETETYLHDIARRLSPALKWRSVVLFEHNAGAAIIKLAMTEQPDVIVMATHGHTGLAHILFGDVAEAVVQAGVAPVLLVHPELIARQRNDDPAAGHAPRLRAVTELKQEHRLVERALAVMEAAVSRVRSGGVVRVRVMEDALQFVREFTDGCHHAKEETALFPVLARADATVGSGPVKILLSEHMAGRTLMNQLEEGIQLMHAGNTAGEKQAADALETYARMQRKHIAKEEDILFRLAKDLLTPEDDEQIARQYEEIEARRSDEEHERFEALVREMEEAVAAPFAAGH